MNIKTHQSACGISIDTSHQYLPKDKQSMLIRFFNKHKIKYTVNELFKENTLNVDENKAAIHTALRTKIDSPNSPINVLVDKTLADMEQFVIDLKNKKTHLKTITDIVNVGIGGSDFGARFGVTALKRYQDPIFNYHFISDSDPDHVEEILSMLNPKTTVFIICSKSFTTIETIDNLKSILAWANTENYSENHCVAITANPDLPKQYGLKTIFPIWSWVGGRFSFCSAINLILMIAIGPEKFKEMLSGAAAMDTHFKNTDITHNLPITLALIDIFNVNTRKGTNRVNLVYGHLLSFFVPFIQQLEMESNGKMRNLQGELIDYDTAEIVWGGLGNQAQHAYLQLLCQGTQFTPCDIICINSQRYKNLQAHVSHVIRAFKNGAQIQTGPIKAEVPFTLINLDDITPSIIGSLVALYEHKVFVKSLFWNINAFNQPGVEYAKMLGKEKTSTQKCKNTYNDIIIS